MVDSQHKTTTSTIECHFESLVVHLPLESKTFESSSASIQSNHLYLAGGKFVIKSKDIAELRVDHEKRSITIHRRADDKVFNLKNAWDDSAFNTLTKRLMKWDNKNNAVVESFLERSSAKALGARKKQQTGRPRAAFGRGGAREASATASTAANTAFANALFSDKKAGFMFGKTKAKKTNQSQLTSMNLDFSDDEGSEQPSPDRPSFAAGVSSSPEKQADDDDWSEHPSDQEVDGEEDQLLPPPSSIGRRAASPKRKHRIQSKIRDDDESDDDDIFDDKVLTTPVKTERQVTPGTKTVPKMEKGTLDMFLKAKPAAPAAAKPNSVAAAAPDSTPPRHGTPSPSRNRHGSPARYATSPRMAQIVKQSMKKNELHRSDNWLCTSPTRTNSAAKARATLFGMASPFSTLQKDDDIQSSPIKREISDTTRLDFSTKNSFGPGTEWRRNRSHGSKDFKRIRTSSWGGPRLPLRSSNRMDAEEPVKDEKPIFRFRGLYNLGNTCYMEASLQMLFTASELMDQLRNRGGPLTRQVVKLAEQVADTSDYRAISPKEVKEAIDKITDKFAGSLQRDAHEFLSDLVDNIHEELEQETVAAKSGSPDAMEVVATDGPNSNGLSMLAAASMELASDRDSEAMVTSRDELEDTASITNENMDIAVAYEPAQPEANEIEVTGTILSSDIKENVELREQSLKPVHTDIDNAHNDHHSSSEESAELLLPTDDFRLTVEVCLKCNSCEYTRSKEEIYRHVSIDICSEDSADATTAAKASVAAGLAKFFQPEVLEIKCEHCSDGRHASQTMRVTSRPQFLILHLKRFIWQENKISAPATTDENMENSPKPPQVEYVLKKKQDPVMLTEKLDMKPFCSPAVDSPSMPTAYSLKSIVYHHGLRAESGHYSADGLRFIPKGTVMDDGLVSTKATPVWVGFDDACTSLTSLDKIVSSEHKQERAYMLLYGLE